MAESGAGGASADMNDPLDTLHLPQTSRVAKGRQEQILKDFEMRRKIQATVVPTDPLQVRKMLRSMGEPVTLFGEREMERRERLKVIVAERGVPVTTTYGEGGPQVVVSVSNQQQELFYTEGSAELESARREIGQWSLRRAKARIFGAKRKREAGEEVDITEALKVISTMVSECSEIADKRPVNCCAFAPDASSLVTAGWTGAAKVWSVPDCKLQYSFHPHEERCTGVAWHPHFAYETMEDVLALATGSADMTARLWTKQGRLLHTLEGHTDRLARIAFHPMGRHMATASFDSTWRLWDVSTGLCLLEQEGHSRAVYSVAFQCDGALVASGGLDAIGRIWDCRTGRSILTLQGHIKKILSMDFAPNGYALVSGGDDHSCRVWDLRKKTCVYTIPAHHSLISQVRYDPHGSAFIMTAGYDNVAKIWSGRDFGLVKVLVSHEGKIMGADVAADGSSRIATVGYDRTLKYWTPQPEFNDTDLF